MGTQGRKELNDDVDLRLNFLWPDQNQRMVSLPAPTYIDFVMSWLQKLLDDETVFPTKSGKSPTGQRVILPSQISGYFAPFRSVGQY